MIKQNLHTTSNTAHVVVLDEGLPPAMILAKEAIEQGRLKDGHALLDSQTEAQLDALIAADPQRVDAMLMMGLMCFRLQQNERAERWFRRVLAQTPEAVAYKQLAFIAHQRGHFSEATDCRLRALALCPEDRDLWSDVGCSLLREGRLYSGIDWLYRRVEDQPNDPIALAHLLFYLHYIPGCDRSARHALYEQWRNVFMTQVVPIHHGTHDRDPQRRLRVGYVSGDLKRHSVAYTIEPILTGHHAEIVEVTVYSFTENPDAVTQRIAQQGNCFRDIRGMDTATVVQQIQDDHIDILVYLASNVDRQRLDLCAHRPAPIQIDWGSMDTTAVKQMDYRLTDPLLEPASDQAFYFESFVPLERGSFCYRPPEFAPPVNALPVASQDMLTFGSCNNGMKINPNVLALWAEILLACPQSRLLLQFAGGDDPRVRDNMLQQMMQRGVAARRIAIRGWQSTQGHWETYHEIDIALDTFPFNGAVTTCEALWMGVPVITLAGDRFVGRTGQAVLTRMGLPHLIARDTRDYVAKAVALAGNRATLIRMRGSLRACMAASTICDAGLHVQSFEQAYRRLWQQWCATSSEPETLVFSFSDQGPLSYTVDTTGLPRQLLQVCTATEEGDLDAARTLLDAALLAEVKTLTQTPSPRADLLFLMGLLCRRIEDPQAARGWYERAAAVEPHPFVYFELAGVCRGIGRLSESIAFLGQALALAPESAELKATLADYQIKAGQHEMGLALLREVVETASDRVNHSKYLWHLHQQPCLEEALLAQAHRDWAMRYAPVTLARAQHERQRDPQRRLRVGYLSGDFCGHSVAYFFEALLEGHDRDQVEVWGYGNVPHQDRVTDRIREKCDHYRNVCAQSDDQVLRWIEEDQIDILVDLSGHTGQNRLSVLAHKPAPIQVSYLGYPDTTGMSQIDYRFTDAWADRTEAQVFYSETLVFLEAGFICYRPPEFSPPVKDLPAQRNGFLTFGSFNNSCKMNGRVLDLWAQVLKAVPESRLLMKFSGADDDTVAAYYTEQLQQRGIVPDRLRLVGHVSAVDHLDLYNQVDVALDTFPYHGTTTTCEALWMGVPVVSLLGQHHVSRVGLSLLQRVGLAVFVADTEKEYVAKAAAFANQVDHLATIRQGLRGHMWKSLLCDKVAHARGVEQAYRRMWAQWIKESV